MADMKEVLEQGEGILWLEPTWVPRAFCVPGQRLKLHPDDLYAFGANRGGIDERWLASTTKADNGTLTTPDEGLSYVLHGDTSNPERTLLRDLVAELGADLIGNALWDEYSGLPVFAKFFDNQGAIPHHLHQRAEHAAEVGRQPKPEAYYFPPQLNNHPGDFPLTFFGLEPGTTKDNVKACLERWNRGDNGITDLSRAYTLVPGEGWYVPTGLLHAPGSLCTYEPQGSSDVAAMFESFANNQPIDWSLLVKDVPEEKHDDLDYIISLIDWDANTLPNVKETYHRPPVPVAPLEEMREGGFEARWIVYGNEYLSAKELTVLPGRSVTIKDDGPYGVIVVQGRGKLGRWDAEAPALIRFRQRTQDEFLVSERAAREGVKVTNLSSSEPLVLLKHFGPTEKAPGKASS